MLAEKQSIFQCDTYQVFSDGENEVGPGVVAEDIGSTKVSFGGPYNNALNSPIFERVWRHVFNDARFGKFDWTVKVDPDCVFLPGRLKMHLLEDVANPNDVVYLNDCDQGLHGPIEVISRGGMAVFKDGIDRCTDALRKEWDWAGEDVFLRHCLGMLGVNRVDDFQILSEGACMWQDPVHKGCGTGHVSFHPFKDESTWFKCLAQAQGSDAQAQGPDAQAQGSDAIYLKRL